MTNRALRWVLAGVVVLALQACVGGGGPSTGDTSLAGEAIEVTTLDGAPVDAGPSGPRPRPRPSTGTELVADTEAQQAAEGTDASESAAETPSLEPAPEPEAEKSDAQRKCEKSKGRWMGVGSGSARTCVQTMRDAGKACSKKSQCSSECLARSRSCAPLKPMLGCNEILDNDGRAITLCIE